MNVYEIVTSRIIESLNNGVVPWRKPWNVDMPKNLVSGKEYRGVNILLLQSSPYACPWWLTYNQARDMNGFVRTGEKGMPVVFWKIYERETDAGTVQKSFVLRYYTVFNAEQCQGIKLPPTMPRAAFDPIDECERVVRSYANPPRIEHGGNRASYTPALDRIDMPVHEAFESSAEYYSTMFHELVHSTGASHRLARKGVTDPIRFGDHGYALEELCAECGAAFLAAHAGIANATLTNSAAYIQSWIRKLRSDPRMVVDAAGQASKAADLIMGNVAAGSTESEEATEQAA
jgi:antirestriction protein ArdC